MTGLQPDDQRARPTSWSPTSRNSTTASRRPDFTIDSTQIAGGAQGLLDEIASSKISGEEDIFSHTDLWDFNANLQGSQTAVSSVRPILDERNAELGKKVDQRFADVEALLQKYRQGDGFVSYDKVTEPQRQELSRSIDALSKEVSQVQGVIAQTVIPVDARDPRRTGHGRGGLSRRKLFGAAGVTAAVVGAAGAGALAGRASAASSATVELQSAVPFRGERQAGIITAAQDRMHFASFDVTTDDRDEVVAMLKQWTDDGRADDARRRGRQGRRRRPQPLRPTAGHR